MAKRIIVLSDGTGNSAAQVWRTNVWRTFESIDLTGSDQIAFYDDGVGTSSFKPLAILGGAFGYGLKRNILSLYKFLCRNYKSASDYGPGGADDQIFGFGFSRGAFTIRVLTGLVLDQGLVKAESEAELDALAVEAYRNYRANHYRTRTGIERPFRAMRDWILRRSHEDSAGKRAIANSRHVATIRFLGLWDTVAAYGLPVDEMTRGISRYLWPLELPNRKIDPKRIERACHALSLDDQRTTFHPVLWDESNLPPPAAPLPSPYLTKQQPVTQIWFSGVHSNVGGGYPDDSLAYIPMYWIWKEAKDCGLRFKASPTADPDAFLSAASKEDKDGRLYDSRSGLGGYYRYGPRSVEELCNVSADDPRDFVSIARPKIHDSVYRRLAVGAHAYAPVGLPKAYDIVTYDPGTGNHEVYTSGPKLPEQTGAALTRYDQQERIVWSTVWRGRGVYFLTVLASLHLLVYPLALTIPPTAEFTTRLRFLSDAIRLVAIPLPSAADRWIDAYARDPALFLIAALSVVFLLGLGSGLRARVTDQMRSLLAVSLAGLHNLAPSPAAVMRDWKPSGVFETAAVVLMIIAVVFGLGINRFGLEPSWLWVPLKTLLEKLSPWTGSIALISLVVLFTPAASVYALRSSTTYKWALRELRLRYAPIVFAVLFCILGGAFASHYVFDVADSFGGLCQASKIDGKVLTASLGGIDRVCYEKDVRKCHVDASAVDGQVAACKTAGDDAAKCTGKTVLFDTRDLCATTSIFVERNNRYQLFVSKYVQPPAGSRFTKDQLDWRFAWSESDPGGKSVSALGTYDDTSCGSEADWDRLRYVGGFMRKVCNYGAALGRQAFAFVVYPLKRSFDRPLGTFTLRYGSTGNEENFIDPDVPPQQGGKLDEIFKPTRDGELFVYLNKPALGFWPDVARNLNSGIASVTVIRIPPKN